MFLFIVRQIINELDPPVNNKELAITIDNPPITLTYDYDDLNNDIDPDFEDIYTGFCPIEINVPIPNFIKKWEYLPMVNYQIEDPTTHETITGTTFTLYDQPISANGKFKVVKWNNFPDNPFYDGLLGEGLVLRKITETPETTDRDWDIQINVQPPLYNLNLGELSVNTGRVITKLPTDYGYDFYGFGSVSYSVNVKYGTLDLGVLRSNNNNEVTIYPVSYNWQYFDAVKYQVQVAQPITTSNFANPNQNITYTLRQLYQGNDNPIGFTPDSTITIAVPPTLYYHAPLNIGELTGNTVQTVTITPQSRGLDYFDDVSYSVNVPQPITVNFTTVVRNNEDYTLSQLYNGQDPVGFTPSSTFRVQINPRLLSNITLNITSNNSTTTLQQLLLDNNIDPTNWNGLDKTCEIHVQVPAEEKLIELEPGQVIPITQNRKRLKYTIYDKDYDSDQDIEFIEEEQPQLLLKRGIVSREIKSRDVNDRSYRNLGNFIIYADINTETTSITIDNNTPLTYSIEQYNQEHGTNYIGFNSIIIDPRTMPLTKLNLVGITNDQDDNAYIDFGQFRQITDLTTSNNSITINYQQSLANTNSNSSWTSKYIYYPVLVLCEDEDNYYLGFLSSSTYYYLAKNGTSQVIPQSLSFTADTYEKIKKIFYLPGFVYYSGTVISLSNISGLNEKINTIRSINRIVDENNNKYNLPSFISYYNEIDSNRTTNITFDYRDFCTLNKLRYSIQSLDETQSMEQ